jgi:hypothetical protein
MLLVPIDLSSEITKCRLELDKYKNESGESLIGSWIGAYQINTALVTPALYMSPSKFW